MQDIRVQKIRHQHILDKLREDRAISVRALAEQFGVSESTIRRDLEQLEELALIQRVHGGAILENDGGVSDREPPFATRQITNRSAKAVVGRLAAEIVRDGEVIFIDGGTTTEFIIPHLAEREDLTVVTCGLNIANALSALPHVHTIVLGGELHVESQSFTGVMAVEALGFFGIRCDRAFVSAGGVSAEHGVTNRILDRIPLKRKAIEISRQAVVLVDGSKVGVTTLGHIAPIEAFHLLITDLSLEHPELTQIRRRGVEVRTPT